MKLTMLFLTTAFLTAHASSLSQKVSYSGKNVPLKTVFTEVEKQTGFVFLYNAPDLAAAKPVTIEAKDVPLTEFLTSVLKEQGLAYFIKKKSIFIVEKTAKNNSLSEVATFSFVPLRGKVLDSAGRPLAGATVSVKNSKISGVTDAEGVFNVNVSEGDILTVTFVGYEPRMIVVTSSMFSSANNLIIILKPFISNLENVEVSVHTGYQTINPERFVGSAVVIDSTILDRQVSRSLLSRLDGSANGLLFVNKTPGGSNNIQLRGVSTLFLNNDLSNLPSQNPLIILDNFPFTGDINTINPNDILSITILKDAVSTSIWGARAGNGVIVIKSKNANRNQRRSIDVRTNFSVSEKPDLHYFPQLSSSEYIDVERYLFDKGYYDIYIQYPQFFKITPVVKTLHQERSQLISKAEAESIINSYRNIDLRDDVSKYVYRNATAWQNYLSLSYGTDLIGYNVSFGVDNNTQGLRNAAGANRYTLNSNIEFKPHKRLEFSVGFNYSSDKLKLGGVTYPINTASGLLYPYAKIAGENGEHLAIPYALNVEYLETLPKDKLLDWQYRPLDELKRTDYVEKKRLLRLNVGAALKLMSWLTADLRFQYNSQKNDIRDLQSVNSYSARNEINRFTNPTTYARAIPVGGIMDITNSSLESYNVRGQLNINRNWNTVHVFTGLVAGEISKAMSLADKHRLYGYNEHTGAFASLMDFKDNYPLYAGGSARIPAGLARTPLKTNNFVSVLGNVSYTYDQRYSVYLSGRRDGTNLIGVSTNNKFKPLWSAGIRWNVNNENFYDLPFLPKLSLRATYGYAGNVVNSVSALSLIAYSRINMFGQLPATILNPANPDLRWEEVKTINWGIDLSCFNDRITATFDWWRKRSNDVIFSFPVDPTSGIISDQVNRNGASLKGKGFDISLNSANIKGKFTWHTSLNFNYAKTVVSKVYNNIKIVTEGPVIREGSIYGAVYAYKWAGLDPATGDPRGFIGKDISQDYQGIFNDEFANQAYIGPLFPQCFGNMLNSFSYSNITLSANIAYRGQYYFRKPALNYQQLFTGMQLHSDYNLRWQKSGDEAYTHVPSLVYPFNNDRDRFYTNSSVHYEQADNIRLQDIRMSYTWLNKRSYKIPIKNIQFYVYANNLNVFLWKASESNYDPDFNTSVFPPARSYVVGVNINLQ